MPGESLDFDATETPVALEDVLTLAVGTLYTLANAGSTIALVRAGATAPSAVARGHPLRPYRSTGVEPASGVKTWVWSRDPDGASLILTEAPD